MHDSLPTGLTARPATLRDALAILAVGQARDVADTGAPDWSLEDVEAELATPGLDLEQDTRLVEDGGEVLAFALREGIDARVTVHPDADGRGIGAWLCEWIEGRAREAGVTQLRQEIGSANTRGRALLESAGYALDQHFWRMTRMLDGSEPEPSWPDGLTARPFERGADERGAYELISDAMRIVPGFTERTFEEWTNRAFSASFAPELSTVVEDGSADGPAGMTLCHRHEDDTGYVDYVAVSERWRGRGVGRALLATSMRAFAAAGMRHAELWVNGRNESATRLYRSVGMDAGTSAERLVKQLR